MNDRYTIWFGDTHEGTEKWLTCGDTYWVASIVNNGKPTGVRIYCEDAMRVMPEVLVRLEEFQAAIVKQLTECHDTE